MQDPKLVIAMQIHKGAIELMSHGHTNSWNDAMQKSRHMMAELYPDEHIGSFSFPYWEFGRNSG